MNPNFLTRLKYFAIPTLHSPNALLHLNLRIESLPRMDDSPCRDILFLFPFELRLPASDAFEKFYMTMFPH